MIEIMRSITTEEELKKYDEYLRKMHELSLKQHKGVVDDEHH